MRDFQLWGQKALVLVRYNPSQMSVRYLEQQRLQVFLVSLSGKLSGLNSKSRTELAQEALSNKESLTTATTTKDSANLPSE